MRPWSVHSRCPGAGGPNARRRGAPPGRPVVAAWCGRLRTSGHLAVTRGGKRGTGLIRRHGFGRGCIGADPAGFTAVTRGRLRLERDHLSVWLRECASDDRSGPSVVRDPAMSRVTAG